MSINIDLVMAYIDSIGVDKARQKIHSYDVSGPSAEDFFGTASVNELDLEIEYLKIPMPISETSKNNSYRYEENNEPISISVKSYTNSIDSDFVNIHQEESSLYIETYQSTYSTSEFANDNIEICDTYYFSDAA